MTATNYTFQKPNATAVNMLRSWLNAVGVPNRPSANTGFDLTVATPEGVGLEVQVTQQSGEAMPGDGVQVVAADLTGKKTGVALAAFWKVTDAAGYERRQPIDRGAEPEPNALGNPRKLHYRDEEFLVAIRHTEFRRSPNPSPERFAHYRATMEKTSWSFLRLNFELCARHGFDINDVMQYARCYVVNFCARYETPQEVFHDNERKCYAYIQQRLNTDLKQVLLKKERSMIPDAETVSIGLYGRPDADAEVSPGEEVDGLDPAYLSRHCQLDCSTPARRRASAAAMLRDLLQTMPHDAMVEKLREASASHSFDFSTRREAARQLRAHVEKCRVCIATGGGVGEQWELVWESDDLSARDLNIPKGPNTNPTGSMTMRRGAWSDVDHRHYFRDDVFGELAWVQDERKPHLSSAEARFEFVVHGVPKGEFVLTVRHNSDTTCLGYRRWNTMTHLRWRAAKSVVSDASLLGSRLRLYKVADGAATRYRVEIDRELDTLPLDPGVQEDEDLGG